MDCRITSSIKHHQTATQLYRTDATAEYRERTSDYYCQSSRKPSRQSPTVAQRRPRHTVPGRKSETSGRRARSARWRPLPTQYVSDQFTAVMARRPLLVFWKSGRRGPPPVKITDGREFNSNQRTKQPDMPKSYQDDIDEFISNELILIIFSLA